MEGREILWNISQPEWMYPLTFLSVLFFFYGFYKHVRFWGKGEEEGESTPFLPRFKSFLSQVFLQRRILRRPYSGLMHLFIFWGLLVLFLGTLILAVQYDLLGPLGGRSFWHGYFYILYSFLLDLFGILALAGTGMALIRRYFLQKTDAVSPWQDGFALWLLLSVLVTGFAVESMRIGVAGTVWERSSFPFSYLTGLLQGLFSVERAKALHLVLWWAHLILALVLIALIPYTKLFHMISASFLAISRAPGTRSALAPVFSEPLRLNPDRLTHLYRKHLVSLDACTRCRRCEEICPVAGEEDGFSPMRIVEELRRGLDDSNNDLGCVNDGGPLGKVWECLTCRSCEEQCPISLEMVEKVVEVRRHRVMALARFPTEIKSLFKSMETFGDPWGMGKSFREDWIQEEESKKRLRDKKGFLVWIGCQTAFHERNKRVALSFTKLLNAIHVDYFLLGKEEVCCGDLARRTGNEYLCRNLILKNIETLQKHGVEKIVTLCPHCFHILKEEYPHWGGRFEVMHYTGLIEDLINQGKLPAQKHLDRAVTYHDSCYLGRYHGQFEGPRSVLRKILQGELVEMEKNRTDSLCCGAGGGSFWLRGNTGEKINARRLNEMREKKVQVICTSCPYCLVMFEEAIRNKEITDLAVIDLAELINSAG